MGSTGFGLNANGLLVMQERGLGFALGQQQVSQKLVGVREFWIGPERRFQLVLRLVEFAGPAEGHRVVVACDCIVRPKAMGDLEMIARFDEFAVAREKIAEISARVGVIRLNPGGLPKSRLGAGLLAAGE